MSMWRPDPTFYPSPKMAMQAPAEKLAFVAMLNGKNNGRHDALGVVDVDPASSGYGKIVGQVDMPNAGDELHHFGWNACSACLCPHAPHPHVERRYLVVPGINSSRIHIIDTKPDPRQPQIVKVIEPETLAARTGYASPHTIHCGPDGILVSALGAPDGGGPGGIFVMDHESFDVLGKWELDRGPQQLAYDFWWHLGYDTIITSEWGTPNMVNKGVNPEILLAGGYGHKVHVWDLLKRRHQQELDLGAENQMVLELRPAHDPTRAYGFAGVVISLKDLSASVWVWYRENGKWAIRKVHRDSRRARRPGEAAAAVAGIQGRAAPDHRHQPLARRPLPVHLLLRHGRIPAVRRDRSLSPRKTGSVHLGGIVRKAAHPKQPKVPLNGAPQMVELSRDGKRIYFTNSLYSAWDEQFYPEGIESWMVKLDAKPRAACRSIPTSSWSSVMARSPDPSGRRRRLLRFLLLLMSETTWSGPRCSYWAPITASIPEWDGYSRWLAACRSSGAALCGRAMTPLGVGHALAVAMVLLVALASRNCRSGGSRWRCSSCW